MQPNDLVVDGQRCGSTWLASALRSHPVICLPSREQSCFFDITYQKGIERLTEAQPRHEAVGELATGSCLPYLARHLPDAGLVMSVHNPVNRAYSYCQSRGAIRSGAFSPVRARRHPPVPAPLRAASCAYFAPDNQRHARFTGWDLDHWSR